MTTPKTRVAHIADVITAYTGKMLSMDGELDGMCRLLEFMVDRKFLTVHTDKGAFQFQLGRAADTVRPYLARQFPWPADLVVPDTTGLPQAERRRVVLAWRDQLIEQHGAAQRVTRIPDGIWADKDPMTELKEMMRPGTPITAGLDTGYSMETMSHHTDGMFRNPRLSEVVEDD